MSIRKIVVIGPGPIFKGGLANYTVSLLKAFAENEANEVHLVSWTQQYPAIVPRDFKDRVSKPQDLGALGIEEHYTLNYNSPRSWNSTAALIASIAPAFVVIQWSIALQGLPLGVIAGRLKRKGIEVFFDLHFVRQKEASLIDGYLSKFALRRASSFIVHSGQTAKELHELLPELALEIQTKRAEVAKGKTKVIKLFHPIYDLFQIKKDFDIEAFKAEHKLKKHVFLFFGFIRKYKGLHFCIEAFHKLRQQRDDVSLVIVGESFWNTLDANKLSTRIKTALFKTAKSILTPGVEDESNYNPLAKIEALRLQDDVLVVNRFVGNDEVYPYFQSADALLLFYEYATPSGVESMAYNFQIPILATAVGHFPESIVEGQTGYLAAGADTDDMVKAMQRIIHHPIAKGTVESVSREWTWGAYASAIEG